jgi:hypothetical protein
MPILHWCPTGDFTFLPIHAAGNYDEEAIECAVDYSFLCTHQLLEDFTLPHRFQVIPHGFHMEI